ncbi:MAG: ferritin-like domain-containing protein [Clostridia bacterium]|nr:ferritin-like domain-containing protein [Clostridia bacterium]
MELKKSKTYLNLARAYASECQARTRYEFVEYGARYNGQKALADIIDKIAYQEFNHARMIYTALQNDSGELIKNIQINAGFPFKEKWDLVQNIKLLAEDEENEAKAYAEFIKVAKEENFPDIVTLFEQIKAVEVQHKKVFEYLYNELKNKTLYKKDKPTKWTCSACGYTSTGFEAFDECPLCKAKQGVVEIKLPSSLAF